MKKYIFLITFLLFPWSCEKDPVIEEMQGEIGIIDSINVINDTIEDPIITNPPQEIFVDMVDIIGLWGLIYYHSINGPLWDNVPEDITHLNLTPNTCYMNTPTGGNTIIVDGDWVFIIQSFDYEFMVLKRYTDDGWSHLYIFERVL